MGLFDAFKSKTEINERSTEDFNYGSFSITSYFGDGGLVTEGQAMKVPAVTSSIELITSSIAQLPIYLYKKEEDGEITKIEDKRVFLLNQEPNDLLSGHNLKKQMVKDYLFHGASYTKVERSRNDVISLHHLPIKELSVTKYKKHGYLYTAEIKLIYENETKNGLEQNIFDPSDLIIVLKDSSDGVTSTGLLKNNGDVFKLAIDEINYSSGILKNGALPIGVLKATSRLTSGAIDRLRNSFENLYGGSKKAGKTLILEEGLDYHPISMKPNEMDLTNQKKNTISEIARVFNVPESMINSSANKYSSNEQNNIYFLQYCISPIVTAIEGAIDKSLLLESEKESGYFFRFDVSEILRTTEKEKIESVVRAMEKGLISINEGRAKINMPNIDVDYFTWNLGSVFYNAETGNMTVPNMGVTIDPNDLQPPGDPQVQVKKEFGQEDQPKDEATKTEEVD